MTALLVNAEGRHAAHPATFSIPSLKKRSLLVVGDEAKLIFESSDGRTERMWVNVMTRLQNGEYKGQLDNSPVFDHGDLSLGDFIRFKPMHVIDISPNDELTD